MTDFSRRCILLMVWLAAAAAALPIVAAQQQQETTSGSFSLNPIWRDVCSQPDVRGLPFCDVSLSIDARVSDYVRRVPVTNQIGMMGNDANGYESLHIPPYQWWSEGLHGALQECVEINEGEDEEIFPPFHRCACPTSFPCPSGLGSAFNDSLYEAIGAAVGLEGRAISLLRRNHTNKISDGLTYWTPTINLQRDPRWGRNQEVPGEDPLLTSRYAKSFVKGLQTNPIRSGANGEVLSTLNRIQIAAGCKHFVANSLENWNNITRHDFDARVSKSDLYNYYFPPFKACVEQQVLGIMCSYNALNGVPTCANEWLLKGVLRNEWDFKGYVTSDCGALADIDRRHRFADSPALASAMALNATVDTNCGSGDYYPTGLLEAFQKEWVNEATVRESFSRLVRVQMLLGMFDYPKASANLNPPKVLSFVDSKEHQILALEAAQQSIVLLKNTDNLLPVATSQKGSGLHLAVIGPHLNSTRDFLSNYYGKRCCSNRKCDDGGSFKGFSCIETPLEALTRDRGDIVTTYAKGCDIDSDDDSGIEDAVEKAEISDVVILLVGLNQSQETEGKDRMFTTLPGKQPELMNRVLDAAGPKTVIVLIHGGTISLGQTVIGQAGSILSASYGGQAASRALASVIFGEYNPTGKLAATIYPPHYVHNKPLTDMSLHERTYRHYSGDSEFEFGHGLSFSQWSIKFDRKRSTSLQLDRFRKPISVDLTLENYGPAGGQSVLLFLVPLDGQMGVREKLIDYTSVPLMAVGESQRITFEVDKGALAWWDQEINDYKIYSGSYLLKARVANGVSDSTELYVYDSVSQNA